MAKPSRKRVLLTVIVLVAVGVLGIALRMAARGEGVPAGDQVWLLRYEAILVIDGEEARVTLLPPRSTQSVVVFGRSIEHFGLRQLKNRGDRLLRYKGDGAGAAEIAAEYKLHLSFHDDPKPAAPEPLTAEARKYYLKVAPSDAKPEGDRRVLLKELRGALKPGEQLVDAIYHHVRDKAELFDPAVETPSRAMVTLCRLAKLPAKVVRGFRLSDADAETRLIRWVHVYLDDRWVAFDPAGGHARQLPDHYVPLAEAEITPSTRQAESLSDEDTAVLITGGSAQMLRYETLPTRVPRGLLAGDRSRFLDALDMTRLDITQQVTLMAVLMLPLGALFTAATRSFIGIRTYGVFTATLLALSLSAVEPVTAAVFLTLVLMIGLLGRKLLPPFEVGRVPRLSIVFTIVAGAMAFTVSIMEFYGLSQQGGSTLLPTVVLTSLVDRGYKVADEEGARVAFARLVWTLIVSAGCYVVLEWEAVAKLLLAYPEGHFFTLAAIVAIGAYGGKTLADRKAFRFLREPPSKKGKPAKASDDGDGD